MKVYCIPNCGCHFPEDFEDTFKPNCTFWPSRGYPPDFPKKWLYKIWQGIFFIDYDLLAEETGFCITTPEMKAIPIPQSKGVKDKGGLDQFEQIVPGYKNWPDDKRRRFQKKWIAYSYSNQGKTTVWDDAMAAYGPVFEEQDKPPAPPRKLTLNRCKCNKCDDVITSTHRHDWVQCKCKAIFTDGGVDYIRRGGALGDIEDMSEYEDLPLLT